MLKLAMIPSRARQALTILLAVLVTLSMSLSVVQARTMSAMDDMMAPMARMAMGDSKHDGCKDCTKGGEGAKAIACGSFCVAPAIATLPQEVLPAPVGASAIASKPVFLLRGTVPAPDPYPPRPSDLG